MRWILYSLIIANFVHLIWQLQSAHVSSHVAQPSYFFNEKVADGDILVMLSERIGSITKPSLVSDSTPSVVGEGSGSRGNPLQQSRKGGANPVGHSSGQQQVPGQSVEESISGLQVVGEANLATTCYRLGPLKSEVAVERVGAQLLAIDVPWRFQVIDLGVEREHWVLVPPRESRQEALQILRELQGRQIDSYLVTEGEARNAISLGLFVREISAISVAEGVAALGYETEVRIKEKPIAEYWIEVSTDIQPDILASRLINSSEIQGDIKFLDSSCEMFAQER